MNRRELIASAGVAAAILATNTATAHDHMDHDHGGKNAKLVDEASSCVKAGEACIAHCLTTFAAGDTSLAACAKSVDELLSVCSTLQKLAVSNSSHLAEIAKISLAVCLECEKECRKHEKEHATCKACADACAACADECRKAA